MHDQPETVIASDDLTFEPIGTAGVGAELAALRPYAERYHALIDALARPREIPVIE